jgi:dihydrofolate reductase
MPGHPTPQLALIVAHDRRRAIGVGGRLPWHLPDDLKHFKALTHGQAVLMGRRTFDSIGRALPGRQNLVLSRDRAFAAEGVEVYADLPSALAACRRDECWIIGGGEIYALGLSLAERLEITEVDVELPHADAWFPAWPTGEFVEAERSHHAADAQHAHAFDFVSYRRRAPSVTTIAALDR